MTELLPGVHKVDGADASPSNVFLIKDKGSSWTLVDTGIPGTHAATLAYLAKLKVDPTAVKKILITHLHRDHTGSLKVLAEKTRARTFAHWIEAAYIAVDPPYDGPGVPPAEPFTVDETLKDGDSVDAGGGLLAYHTPGHTPGSTSYYQPERKLLFCGDLFFGTDDGGAILTVPEYTHHTPTATISGRRMGQLSIDALFTHHGDPILTKGGAAVRAAVQKKA